MPAFLVPLGSSLPDHPLPVGLERVQVEKENHTCIQGTALAVGVHEIRLYGWA